jgi:hypothetical protein
MSRVEISIDELVLRGVPPEMVDGVAAQIEEQLASRARSDPAAVARLTDIDSPTVRLTGPSTPVAGPVGLGALFADAVWSAATGSPGISGQATASPSGATP